MRIMAYLCSMLPDREVARLVRKLLQKYLDVPVEVLEGGAHGNVHPGYRPDFQVQAGPYHFVVESKATGTTDQVASAARYLQPFAAADTGSLPIIVVPFMSQGGKAYAREQGVAWLDLSGNARIVAPGLRIVVEGKPNQFVRPGRPRNLFAPRSARVTRALLLDPTKHQTQAELARATGLNRGTVSRVVAALLDANLIERDPLDENEAASVIRVPDPRLLLEAWRDAVDFTKQHIYRFTVAARSGDALVRRAAAFLTDSHVDPAATGLAAAWYYAPYADFRTVSFYVRELPSQHQLMSVLGAREETRGANLWLVIPKDDGVRMGMNHLKGVPCVSAVQAYVDLKGHPERASDAATALRDEYLQWE